MLWPDPVLRDLVKNPRDNRESDRGLKSSVLGNDRDWDYTQLVILSVCCFILVWQNVWYVRISTFC